MPSFKSFSPMVRQLSSPPLLIQPTQKAKERKQNIDIIHIPHTNTSLPPLKHPPACSLETFKANQVLFCFVLF